MAARTSLHDRTDPADRTAPTPRRPSGRLPGRGPGAALTRMRRAVLRRRRLLAALSAGIAAGTALLVLAPPEPVTTPVLVAARDLPAGTTLTAADLTTVDVPPAAVPDHSVTAADGVGRVLASAMRRGEPLTDAGLLGPGLLTGDTGRVAVPVRLSDADQAALLAVGDRIDLFATDPTEGSTTVVARDASVLAVPPEAGSGANGTVIGGRLVVVAAAPESMDAITSASVVGFVTFAWSDS